ncbi:halocyanin domain-containing protein [Natronomonas halophila]|uniref:halocyanin domain-containing protein n=1 Tax=Natronomonas halophila TaxID=2747817 RepID=UPI0015B5CFEC|nr:halocyanin domain-containing protein [Natronomonas halophila]QLD84270.1 halocyanin domain-containing protein [Natronomonas halophila]
MRELSRRRFVQATGATVAVGAVAGCTGDSGNGNGNGNGNGDTPTPGGNGGDVPQEIADHLDGANLYEGSVEDLTGQDEVTVNVGAGDGLAFDPPAIRISSSTTVVWEWTGAGGSHNVASVEGSESDFTSDYSNEEGYTFEQSFDNTGIQLYVCEPHQTQGMKGAIEVVE